MYMLFELCFFSIPSSISCLFIHLGFTSTGCSNLLKLIQEKVKFLLTYGCKINKKIITWILSTQKSDKCISSAQPTLNQTFMKIFSLTYHCFRKCFKGQTSIILNNIRTCDMLICYPSTAGGKINCSGIVDGESGILFFWMYSVKFDSRVGALLENFPILKIKNK